MADVTLTMGLDTAELKAGIARAQNEIKGMGNQLTDSLRKPTTQAGVLTTAMAGVGKSVKRSIKDFNDLVFAPIAIAAVAQQFYQLGNQVEAFVEDSLKSGAVRASEFINALDFTNPAESLRKLDEQMAAVNAKIGVSGGPQTISAGPGAPGVTVDSGADLEAERNRLLKARETLERGIETIRDRNFKRVEESLDYEQRLLDIQKLRLEGGGAEAARQQASLAYAREMARIKRDETLTPWQRQRALDRLSGLSSQAGDQSVREFYARGRYKPSQIESGTYLSSLGMGAFGLGSGGSGGGAEAGPVPKKITITNQKLDKIDRVLQLIRQDFQRGGGNGPVPGLRP